MSDQTTNSYDTEENREQTEKLLTLSEDELFEQLGLELYREAGKILYAAIHEVVPNFDDDGVEASMTFTQLGISPDDKAAILALALTKAEQTGLRMAEEGESDFDPITIREAMTYILGVS